MSGLILPIAGALLNRYRKRHPTQSGSFSSGDRGPAPAGYESLWNNNPYANFDYRHTWWQQFLEGLGVRTNFDAFRESMAVNAKEADFQLAQKVYNEEYNSPLQQAARQREAGLNPDLNGNVDSGSASPLEPDPNAPLSPEASDMSKLQAFGNIIFQGFTMAMGFAKDTFALQQMSLALQTGRTENVESMFRTASQLVSSFVPANYPGDDDSEWANRESELIRSVIEGSGYNARQRGAMMTIVNRLYSSAPKTKEQWDQWRDQLISQADYRKVSSQEQFSPEQEVMQIFAEELAKEADLVSKREAKNASARAELEGAQIAKDMQYTNQFDVGAAAAAENAGNRNQAQSANMDRELNSVMARIIDKLSTKASNGNVFASSVVMALSLLRMMSMSKTSGQTPFGSINTTTVGF